MAVELGDTIGQVGAGAYRLVKGKDVDITEAIDGTSITIANDDLFLIDDGPTGTQATTKKVTGSQLKTFIGSITVDSSITDGSTNPVQNNAVHDALDLKLNLAGGTMSGDTVLQNDVKVVFGNAGEYIKGDGTDLLMHSSGDVILDSDGGDVAIQSSGSATPRLTLRNTSDAYGTPPVISFEVVPNNVGTGTNTGASGDDIGRFDFKSNDGAGNLTTYARILSEISTATDGSEGGKISLQVASHDNEMVDALIVEDGSEEDEVDVTIGNGDNSLTIIKGNLAFGDNATSVNSVLAELDLASDSPTALTTQRAVKNYVDTNRRWSIETGGYRSNNNSSTLYYFQYRPNGEVWSNTDSSPTSLSYADSYASMLVAPYAGKVTKISVHGYASDTGTTDPVKFYVFKGTPAVGSYMVLTQIGATGAITPMAYRQFVEHTTISSSNTFSQHDAIYVMYKKDSTSGNQDLYFSVTVSGEYTD